MRIGMQSWGSEGDLRPFFALGRGLAARGHRVTLAYSSVEGRDYSALASRCGLDARPVGLEWIRAHEEASARALRDILTLSPLGQLSRIIDTYLDPLTSAMRDAASTLAAENELVVGHLLAHPAAAAAERARRPFVLVTPAPTLPTRTAPPPGSPSLGPLNSLLWWIARRLMARILMPRVNAVRRELGLEPLSQPHDAPAGNARHVLAAMSPTLFPRPPDWDARWLVSGFLELPPESDGWSPPPALERFLSDGPPPVFMTLGSMMLISPELGRASVELLGEAARRSERRVILQAPAGLTAQLTASATLHLVDRVPHGAVLPRCAAVVHHGGAGTTQAALAAGRPSVVVPHLVDQFFWARRLEALGAAAGVVARRGASGRRLAALVQEAAASQSLRGAAERLGRALRAERGVDVACEAIERVAAAAPAA